MFRPRQDVGPSLPAGVAEHVRHVPLFRIPIVSHVARFAATLPPGCRLLDAGAGESPYRPLFAHCDITTTDWPSSVHAGAQTADVIADLRSLPLDDATFDALLCTEVIEHIEEPAEVAHELARVLRPRARVLLTVPFVIGLHEEPYDFQRFTRFGLESLLRSTGFEDVEVTPLGGAFSASAVTLTAALAAALIERRGTRPRSRIVRRTAFGIAVRGLDALAPRLDVFDGSGRLPLGWAVWARRST